MFLSAIRVLFNYFQNRRCESRALADDFNAPGALAIAWEAIREANRATGEAEKRALLETVLGFDRVLGLGLAEAIGETLPADVAALIEKREAARATRDWAAADELRETIRQHGYEIEDTPSGTRWRRSAQGEADDDTA